MLPLDFIMGNSTIFDILRSAFQLNYIGNIYKLIPANYSLWYTKLNSKNMITDSWFVWSPLQKQMKILFLAYLGVLWNHKSEWFFITCSLDVLCIWSRDWCFKLGPPLINPSWLLRNKLKLVFIVGILRLSIWRDFFFILKKTNPIFLDFIVFVW